MKGVLLILVAYTFCNVPTLFAQDDPEPRRQERPTRVARLVSNCESEGCQCCYVMNARRVLCIEENAGQENISTIWGELIEENIRGRTFRFYNITSDQLDVIREVMAVLPENYLPALPVNFRIAVPLTGALAPSRPGRRDSKDGDGHSIGGGARRCVRRNDLYDVITLHPMAFDREERTNVRITLLHEIGHFVDREFQLAEHYGNLPEYRDQFQDYLNSSYTRDGRTVYYYRGDSRGPSEVIAQGIASYHFRKNWRSRGGAQYEPDGVWFDAENRTPDPAIPGKLVNPYGHPFPIWLRSIIRDHLGVADPAPPRRSR
ncbi:MAG: hypothetical protein IT266_02475 [Saprospiraceae bacterium]|nr:hypothetical protein [Saprospiraceae bacterium]